ncbi:hypothetical protein [Azorhizobium doebereinerae]|uniref:hypothetical protein n=1 Tax=Azorhizobium doebereinerae TaxID=281091 RepID=UPI000426E06E|nr:hypothetical protein [Azorhizobium doebereinerae]
MPSLAWRVLTLGVAAAGIYCGAVALYAFGMEGVAQSAVPPGRMRAPATEPAFAAAEAAWGAAAAGWRHMGLTGRAELDTARGALLHPPQTSAQWADRAAQISAALASNPTAAFLWAELARAELVQTDLARADPGAADRGAAAFAALRMAQVTAPREPVHTLARALLVLRHWPQVTASPEAGTLKGAFGDLLIQDVVNGWAYYTPFERQVLRASFELLPPTDAAALRVPLAARLGPIAAGQLFPAAP